MRRIPTLALTIALGAVSVIGVTVLGAVFGAVAAAQEPSASTQRAAPPERGAAASARSEIIDPFPRATRAAAAITEIVVELIDPFEGTPRNTAAGAQSARARSGAASAAVHSEIVDPFHAGAAVISEILDPWAL